MGDLDTRVFLFLNHAFAGVLMPAAILSAIGGGWGALLALPLFFSPRTRGMARALAGVLVSTALVVFALKALIGRARPCNCIPGIHAQVFSAPTDFSFPSGHAAGSFAFTVFLACVLVGSGRPTPSKGRVIGAVLLVLLAISVGLSRIALGVHFPGDVLAGAVIGATIARVGATFHLRKTRTKASEAAASGSQ